MKVIMLENFEGFFKNFLSDSKKVDPFFFFVLNLERIRKENTRKGKESHNSELF